MRSVWLAVLAMGVQFAFAFASNATPAHSGSISPQSERLDPQDRNLEAEDSKSVPIIYARSNGTRLEFKILQLADLHYTGDPTHECRQSSEFLTSNHKPCSEATTTEFVNALLDLEKPDYVVFSGDMIQTFHPDKRQAAVDAFTQGVEARKIPYSVVFGNHDDENGFTRNEILYKVFQKKYSYVQAGPTVLDSVGNYAYAVQAPKWGAWGDWQDVVLRMYFLDSGAYPNLQMYPSTTSKYDWIKIPQIEYYRKLSDSHKQGTHDRIPALMFFHIPLPEYEDANTGNRNGDENEAVSAPTVNKELFTTLAELNEVKAVFVGHDHLNEFCYKRQGVQLCYGGGTGFGEAYGRTDFARRARVIEWTVDNQNHRTIRSWKRHFGDMDKKYTEETLYQDTGLK